ncbi:MAG: hypothetical protein K5866_10785 [Treponema sp.]|nr:hypothetical protein [Treponema sp.]
MKVAFFGASTVQQINGYADHFSLKNPQYKCKKFGYGGMHLNNAGIVFLDKVIKWKPDICFVDWFCTDYINQDGKVELYIKTLLEKFSRINCRSIFLFLPHNDQEEDRKLFYQNTKKLVLDLGLEHICIDQLLANENISDIVRDRIHTNQLGAEKYSLILSNYLKEHKAVNIISFGKNIFSDIKSVKVNKVFDKKISFDGNCFIVGMTQLVGNFTGLLDKVTKDSSQEILLWDRWCYYTRNHFALSFEVSGKTDLFVTNKKFDTSTCKSDLDFTLFKKNLVIKKIYYVGESLKVCKKGGSSLYFWLKILRCKLGAIKYRILQTLRK